MMIGTSSFLIFGIILALLCWFVTFISHKNLTPFFIIYLRIIGTFYLVSLIWFFSPLSTDEKLLKVVWNNPFLTFLAKLADAIALLSPSILFLSTLYLLITQRKNYSKLYYFGLVFIALGSLLFNFLIINNSST